ncbi:MAG: tetratricopeptide repeat protein [Chloroflexota bacterium]
MEQYQSVDELLNRRDVKRAEILIARFLRADPSVQERAHLLVARARARLLSARIDDALEDLHTARTLLPDDFQTPQTLELLGDAHFARFELASVGFADRSDTVHALDAYDRILADYPLYNNRGWVFYQRGRVLLTENRSDDSLECFQQALLAQSTVPALTAYCYERMGFVASYERREFDRALSFLNKAVATYPTNEDRRWLVHIHTLRSRVLREMHDYDAAVEAANTAISVAASAEGKAGLADALLTTAEMLALVEGRERDVIAHLQHYIQITKKPLGIDVTWSRIHEMLGDAYFASSQLPTAVAAYQAALQFNPYTPWELSLHYRIARTLYQMGDYEKTIQAVGKMFQAAAADGQSVGDYRVYNILGNAHFALQNYPEAAIAYQTALQMAPASSDSLDKIRQYHQFALDLSRPI